MKWLQRPVIAFAALLGGLALAKEFAQPRGLRVGEGSVLGIPYSFRIPTGADLKRRYWNPDGAVLAPPLWGVGVYPNLPALLRRVGLWND